VEAVQVRHGEVEQHHGGLDRLHRLERRAAARRAHDVEALQLEPDGHRAADRRIVVDQQHDRPAARPARRLAVSHGAPVRSRG
jgi:hypothetical protein